MPLFASLHHASNTPEPEAQKKLLEQTEWLQAHHSKVQEKAEQQIQNIRKAPHAGLENFFHAYPITSAEGKALMRLAEGLLRIPDTHNANALMHEVMRKTQWRAHLREQESLAVKASGLGLDMVRHLFSLGGWIEKITDPLARESIKHAIRSMGEHFVMGETIEHAIEKMQSLKPGALASFDMLGEGARTEAQADTFCEAYLRAIEALPAGSAHSISVKLSALSSFYEWRKFPQLKHSLLPRVLRICERAAEKNIALTLDAEESFTLALQLTILEECLAHPALKNWNGLGVAVQAYHKAAHEVLAHLLDLARTHEKRIPVRLVKGAYWDSEIKHAQMHGLKEYPVWTSKHATDLNYYQCAAFMLNHSSEIIPQYATHNAYSLAMLEAIAQGRSFECQRLHGMGEALYRDTSHPLRIYAPVGSYQTLLPYLIRRLLENGANSSFVHALADPERAVETLVENPRDAKGASILPKPSALYAPHRANSQGYELGDPYQWEEWEKEWAHEQEKIGAQNAFKKFRFGRPKTRRIIAPHNRNETLGWVQECSAKEAKKALAEAYRAFPTWNATPVEARATLLESLADALETNSTSYLRLLICEAGKTRADALAEIREAVDFCRYYASEARTLYAPRMLASAVGESNSLRLKGRGVFFCVSPWNFPLAICIGQIAAALVSGNTVLAKPAEQTSLIAQKLVTQMQDIGFPKSVIQCLPGDGAQIAGMLLPDPRIAGVAFTGSVEVAKDIQKKLAARSGAIPVLIAETGGQNAMIVDSTALLEKTLDDVMISAFGSSGQRCSALRVLYLQEEIYEAFEQLLIGALARWKVEAPTSRAADSAAVIDKQAYDRLKTHIEKWKKKGAQIAAAPLAPDLETQGYFVPPHAFAIQSMRELKEEIFGPVLHVVRYKIQDLDKVIEEINASGFGLTFGIQTRLESRAEYLRSKIHAGNVYVNRSMIGATVGVQPFGGEGLSGTGPKAGGPFTLLRYSTEQTYSVNTTAIGGNVELLGLEMNVQK